MPHIAIKILTDYKTMNHKHKNLWQQSVQQVYITNRIRESTANPKQVVGYNAHAKIERIEQTHSVLAYQRAAQPV